MPEDNVSKKKDKRKKLYFRIGEKGRSFKGTVSPVNCLKVMSFKSQWHRHVVLIFKKFKLLFNFILVFEVLMLRLQNHSNYHFYFEYG
jgi:hypothetical protein